MGLKRIQIAVGEHYYTVTIGTMLLSDPDYFAALEQDQQCMVVTNQTLAPLYLERVCNSLSARGVKVDTIILPDGEQYKTLLTLSQIFDALLEQQHGRDTALLALGGGVIGDLTGFAAACYQRGIPFIAVPTTLLAQVDAAIGGKTAVNHILGKNMIGAFHQPASVLIDIGCLTTLPTRQFISGLAEIIKYGVALDAQFFCWLEKNLEALLQLKPKALVYAISHCCQLKATVIANDERDHGLRRLLNFGHTFGHAIEAKTGYSDWLHGEAVAVGMVMAAVTAEQLGLCESTLVTRLKALLARAQLPTQAPSTLPPEAYLPYLWRDKKVHNKQLHMILPIAIGQAVLKWVTQPTVKAAIAACRSRA